MPKHYFKEYIPLIDEAFARNQSVTIPVKGNSMQPTLSPGDAVTLSSMDGHTVQRGDILLYRRIDGSYILHRVVRVTADTLEFCGDAQVAVEKGVPSSAVIAFVSGYEKDGTYRGLEDIRNEGRHRLSSRVWRRGANRLRRFRKTTNINNKEALSYIGRHMKKHILSLVIMCVASMAAAIAGLAMAMVSGHIIDKAISGEMNHFREWFYLLFALLILAVGCNVLYSQLRVRASGKMKICIREELFSLLLSKSYLHVQKIHSGEVLNRFTADVQVIVDNGTTMIPQVISIVTKLIGGVAFMFVVEPLFTGIMLCVGIVAVVILQLCSRYYKHVHKECQESEGKTRSFVQECVENLMVIKSFNSFNGLKMLLKDRQWFNFKKNVQRNWYANIGNTAMYAGFTFAYYAGLAWGILRVAGVFGASMTVGVFASFLQIMEQVRSPFRSASGVLPQFYSMCASAERLLELYRLPSEEVHETPISSDDLYRDMSSICLNHVSFAYDRHTRVLTDASCSFQKGQFTAIVGGSGIGKSTIIKLLLGFLNPQKGEVLIRAKDSVVPVSAATRDVFAYVPQGNMVLSGTLLQNLTLGNEDVTEEDVHTALELACLSDTVAALPNGIHTSIGERGIGLSEGQIQRLAIARALISRSPVLLMDECTSALDAVTEQKLLDHLSSLKDRTILFISHKEAVLRTADTVLEIQNQQITTVSE